MDNYEVLVKLSNVNALKNHNIGWIHESKNFLDTKNQSVC